jgi:hypothetical protein
MTLGQLSVCGVESAVNECGNLLVRQVFATRFKRFSTQPRIQRVEGLKSLWRLARTLSAIFARQQMCVCAQ